jgi:hypothetical protein
MQQQFCSYCQRFRDGPFRRTGNQGVTRICPTCFALRRSMRRANKPPAARLTRRQQQQT